jgi:hypothetical protein
MSAAPGSACRWALTTRARNETDGSGSEEDRVLLWIDYALFERADAAVAASSLTRNIKVRVECILVVVRLGNNKPVRAADQALPNLADGDEVVYSLLNYPMNIGESGMNKSGEGNMWVSKTWMWVCIGTGLPIPSPTTGVPMTENT